MYRPRGLMAKASDFESEDWGFESLRGRVSFVKIRKQPFRYYFKCQFQRHIRIWTGSWVRLQTEVKQLARFR